MNRKDIRINYAPIAPYRPMSRTASILVGVSIIMLTMTILMGTVTLLLLQHG